MSNFTPRQVQFAKDKGHKWMFVDPSNRVRSNVEQPKIHTVEHYFGPLLEWQPSGEVIGGYQEDKWWTNTLEKIA